MAREFEEVEVRVGDEILTIRVPKGTPDEVIKQRVRELEARPSQRPTPLRGAGTVRIFGVPGTSRAAVRGAVEALPAPLRFAAEAGPSIIGTVAGAAAGGLAAPFTAGIVNPLTGAVAGGVAGELLAQETGLAPESTFAKVAAGTGPFVGPAVVKGGQLFLRGLGRVPGVSDAARILRVEEASQRLLQLGADVLAKGQGLLRHSADRLFEAVRRAGVQIKPQDLTSTLQTLDELATEVRPFRSRPEARQILRTIQTIRQDLGVRRPETVSRIRTDVADPDVARLLPEQVALPEIAFKDILRIRQLVGADVGSFERAAGVKLGAAKKMFGSIAEDVDRIAAAGGRTGRVATISKAAAQRAKLEFAVADFDALVRGHLKILGETGDQAVDLNAVRLGLRALTDPKDARFDKNFATALRGELPEIESFLERAAKLVQSTQVGPGGGLVIRGAAARATRSVLGLATGGLLGGAAGGGGGAAVGLAGGLLGAQAPELLRGALLTSRGRHVLERLIRAGRGRINMGALATLSQTLTQATRTESGREFIGEMVSSPGGEAVMERVGPLIPERFRTPLSGLRVAPE